MPEWTIKEQSIAVPQMKAFDPDDYMTKEACEKEHKEKEKRYGDIIKASEEDRKLLWKETHDLGEKVDKHKEIINGKFDKISNKIMLIMFGIICSLIATLWTSHNTNEKGSERFKQLNEIRIEQNQATAALMREFQKNIAEIKGEQSHVKSSKAKDN